VNNKPKPPDGWVNIEDFKLKDYPELVKILEEWRGIQYSEKELDSQIFPNMDEEFDLSPKGSKS
jgi:hypothetical protein